MHKFAFLVILSLISLSLADDPCKPSQIHLALSDDFTSNPASTSPIKAIFHTQESCDSAYISLDTLTGTQNITATAVNYFTANYSDGTYETYVHIFDFPALNYDQVYQYTCYADNLGDHTPQGPFSFYNPNPNPNGQPVTVIVFGDFGTTSDGQDTLAMLTSIQDTNFTDISAYIHMGDIAYDLESDAGETGDSFMNDIQVFASSMPYMISPGNHETMANFSNVNMRFKMPLFTQTQNHYYSYNLGNMHFATVNLDLAILYPELLEYMANWLDNDLAQANANREERPWIIVYTHRPMYCSKDNGDCNVNAQTFSVLEDIINQYNVDLYMSGHVHAYERMLPIYQGEIASFEQVAGDTNYNYIINPKAPVYIVQGMAGHTGDPEGKKAYDPLEFSVDIDMEYSLLSLTAMNNTHLFIQDIHSSSGKVHDFCYIIKGVSDDYSPFN